MAAKPGLIAKAPAPLKNKCHNHVKEEYQLLRHHEIICHSIFGIHHWVILEIQTIHQMEVGPEISILKIITIRHDSSKQS